MFEESEGIGRRLGERDLLTQALIDQATLIAHIVAGWSPPAPGVADADEESQRRARTRLSVAAEASDAERVGPQRFAQQIAVLHNLLMDYDIALELLEGLESQVRDTGPEDELVVVLEDQMGVLANRLTQDRTPEEREADFRRANGLADEIRASGRWTDRADSFSRACRTNFDGEQDAATAHRPSTEEELERAVSLVGEAIEHLRAEQFQEGVALSEQAAEIFKNLGYHKGRQAAVGDQAGGLQALGHWDEAYTLRAEEVALCRDLEDEDDLTLALEGLAECSMNRAFELDDQLYEGRLDNTERHLELAALWYQRAVAAWRELGRPEEIAMSYSREGMAILHGSGDLKRALGLQDEAVRICREHDIQPGLAASLASRADVLDALGDKKAAKAARKDANRIHRTLG